MEIRLNEFEFKAAAEVGLRRFIFAMTHKLRGDHNFAKTNKGDGWGTHIEGACAEFAVAKALNLEYDGYVGFPNPAYPDVAPNVQVRSTHSERNRLIVHPQDPNDHNYVLITGRAPTYRVMGWIVGAEAKKRDWWADPTGTGRPAFFVPHHAMRPLRELRG